MSAIVHSANTGPESKITTGQFLASKSEFDGRYRSGLFLAFALILFSSGNPIFAPGGRSELLLIPFALGLLVAIQASRHKYKNAWSILILALFCAINLAQIASSFGAPIQSALGYLLRLFVAYGICRLARNAPLLIVNAMSILAAIAIAVFGMQVVCHVFALDLAEALKPMAFAQGAADHIYTLIHNFNGPLDRFRNAGIFWEPGAFSGYCSVALILLALIRDKYSSHKYRLRLSILLIAIATSQSTTGFVVLPPILLLHLSLAARKQTSVVPVVAVWLMGALCIGSLAYIIMNAPAVRDKIQDQIAEVVTGKGHWQDTRVGTMIADVTDIMQRPWLGWGANPLIRPSMANASVAIQHSVGNGLSNFLARFGVVGFITYVVATTHGLMISTSRGLVASSFSTVLLCVILVGENYLNYPLFLAFMFLGAQEIRGEMFHVRQYSDITIDVVA